MLRIFCLIALQLSVSRAQGRIGIVDLRGPAEERRDLRDAIERAVEARGFQVISDAEVGYVQVTARELFDCFAEDRCRTEIGRRLQADLLLTGQITKEDDHWRATLSVHAVDLGTTKNQVIQCPSCSVEAFRDQLVQTVNDLIVTQRAAIEARRRHPVDLKLKLTPPIAEAPKPPSWWTVKRIASVAMLAAGGALVISGIPLLAIDGSCGDDHCVFVHNTGAGGGALLGIGAALVVTGAVVLLTSRSAQSVPLSAIERSFTSATHW